MTIRPVMSPRIWLLSFAFWTVFGVISAAQVYVRATTRSGGVTEVANIVYFYWAWALLTPFILHTALAALGRSGSIARRILALVPTLVLVLIAQGALYSVFGIVAGRVGNDPFAVLATRSIVQHFAGNVLTYSAIVGAVAVLEQYRRARQFETDLARAQLSALSAQLNPHFLFNSLNVISGLVATRDAETANRAIARLGEVLRASLEASPTSTVPFRDELTLARKYMEIAQLRFGERLTVSEQIDDDALDAPIPPLLLQPLIENALRHGIGARADGGTIQISARCSDGHVDVTVQDDGPGLSAAAALGTAHAGVGLDNVRRRLAYHFGDRAGLTLGNVPGGGACATVRVPRTS